MGTWVIRFAVPDEGALRIAVKDAIDIAGEITTAGCRAVAERAVPAQRDAACLAGFRAAGVAIVGKTTVDEMCLSASGRNDWLGSPVNPRAAERITGGSSSGSAVAVTTGEVDIGLGTDTGGSIRIPAACCGIVGLKTTWGRISLDGVWPTVPSMDTVGSLARDVATLTTAMHLLDPTWRPAGAASRVGRVRVPGAEDDAVDRALAAAGLEVSTVELDAWRRTTQAFDTIFLAEFHDQHNALLGLDGVSRFVNSALRAGATITAEQLARAQDVRERWQASLGALFDSVDALAVPTLVAPPPTVAEVKDFPLIALTAPINLAGVPALSMPVGTAEPIPPSLQLIGPNGSDEMLCATAAVIEAAQPSPSRT